MEANDKPVFVTIRVGSKEHCLKLITAAYQAAGFLPEDISNGYRNYLILLGQLTQQGEYSAATKVKFPFHDTYKEFEKHIHNFLGDYIRSPMRRQAIISNREDYEENIGDLPGEIGRILEKMLDQRDALADVSIILDDPITNSLLYLDNPSRMDLHDLTDGRKTPADETLERKIMASPAIYQFIYDNSKLLDGVISTTSRAKAAKITR